MSLVPFSLRNVSKRVRAQLVLMALLAALLAVVCDSVIIKKTGPETPFLGDADFFANIAQSLAANHGYRLAKSPWPNELNTSRAPLYPAVLSLTFRMFPGAQVGPASRFTDAILHGVTAGLMVLLVYQLAGTLWGAALCGCALAIYPPEAAIVVGGLSEVAFLVAMLLGLILVLEGGKMAWAGAFFGGLSVLARSNCLLLPVFIVLLLVVFHPKAPRDIKQLGRITVLCAFFYCCPLLWMLRNYAATGVFPLLNTMEGETLYGANNALVANDLGEWGYWTMPDEIPGEDKKMDLARTRSEVELSTYYHRKALEFIKGNLPAMPRLIVGKLVRGFIPVPWVPLAASYVAFGARALLYVAFIGAFALWHRKRQFYTAFVGGMFLVTLTTTVIYYGLYRFTFCMEPFLLPVVAAAFQERRLLPSRTEGVASRLHPVLP
jgi:hypothetical protein